MPDALKVGKDCLNCMDGDSGCLLQEIPGGPGA